MRCSHMHPYTIRSVWNLWCVCFFVACADLFIYVFQVPDRSSNPRVDTPQAHVRIVGPHPSGTKASASPIDDYIFRISELEDWFTLVLLLTRIPLEYPVFQPSLI
jgi:hypothetical protein